MPETPSMKLALSPPSPLLIKFGDLTISEPGKTIGRKEAQASPVLSLPASIADSSKTYFVLCLDLDAPFPSWPVLGPICHGVWTDLKVGEEVEGYKVLESNETPVAFWGPPGPPPGSAVHRYTFMVWEQPEGVTAASTRKVLGLTEGQPISIRQRMRFDAEGFEKNLGLGTAICGNYFNSN